MGMHRDLLGLGYLLLIFEKEGLFNFLVPSEKKCVVISIKVYLFTEETIKLSKFLNGIYFIMISVYNVDAICKLLSDKISIIGE